MIDGKDVNFLDFFYILFNSRDLRKEKMSRDKALVGHPRIKTSLMDN